MKNQLIASFYRAEDYFFRSISKECLEFDEVATAYYTGVDTEHDNIVFVRNDNGTIETILKRCNDFFKLNHSPWTLVVTEQYISDALERCLQNIHYSFIGMSEAMYIDLKKQHKFDLFDNLDIRVASENLEQWMIPLIEAFDLPSKVMQQYADVHKRALNNSANFHHFTLFNNNLPIASLTLSFDDNNARIHDVATLPAYQNKGYATHLMKYAINEAIHLGANYCFLEASEAGLSVYEKLGFQALFKNRTYSLL